MPLTNSVTANGISISMNIVQALSIIIASGVAIYGINAWRRELKGKKEHDLAEEVLALSYECKDKLRAIRNPGSFGGEGKSRKPEPHETPETTKQLNMAYVTFERYHSYQETFNRLFSLRYRFMALFGATAAQPIEEIRLSLNDIFVSAHMLADLWTRKTPSFSSDKKENEYYEGIQKHQKVIWGNFGGSDEFDQKINSIIAKLEDFCSKILKKS